MLAAVRSAEFVSGVGITACIAAFVLPGCLLVIPHAADFSPLRRQAFLAALECLVPACAVGAVVALWLTKTVDPGYVELRPDGQPLDDETQRALEQSSGLPSSFSSPPIRRKRQQTSDAACDAASPAALPESAAQLSAAYAADPEGFEELCSLCLVWRAARSAHCHQCGRCVLRFDHHCGVIAACIGQGNARFFLVMLAMLGCGCALLLAADVLWLLRIPLSSSDQWRSSWQPYAALFLLLLYSYALMLAPLAAFHCALLLTDRTTRELYGSQQQRSLAASEAKRGRGCGRRAMKGLREVCCAPVRCLGVWRHRADGQQPPVSREQAKRRNEELLRRHLGTASGQSERPPAVSLLIVDGGQGADTAVH